ncbi:hypothetical protein NFX46_33815 [Streptomyces phaeoluteigriseus]|uniref:Uncharacterized protein n=1 Tax=Streptomyces phaeoluteigriseus TaxID=114686 RepID=A0ABY4ZHB6_9ACTN|nr:hypothetical protein [Streptomyces phaeoluteigriseus]USQ88291.1 hypothetical protein NFX46_33815 [Streptomyces phaeoluteigriseus]
MRRVRPGVAAARGSTGGASPAASRPAASRPAASRPAGEERALTSVAAGENYREQQDDGKERIRPADLPRLWHVTLSVSGEEADLTEVRRALEQLAHDHPFLLTSRYAVDHAEIRYWEEARDLHDAAAVALRLWGEHRQTAGLPPWEIVGLEVIDRQTYHLRIAEGYGPAPATPVGVHPY